MLVCKRLIFSGIFGKILDHLSSTWAQKRLPELNVHSMGGGFARKKTGSKPFGIKISFQISTEQCVLLSQEHCSDAQCVSRVGMPNPPVWVGEKIMCFKSFGRGPFMNLTMILSTSFLISLLGRGKIVAIWVNLDRRQILVILTLAETDNLVVDQIPISVLTELIAFRQLSSNWSRLPVI